MCCNICSYFGLEQTLKTKGKARLFYGIWHHTSRWPHDGATFGLRRESSTIRCAFWPPRRSFIFVGNLEWRYYCIVLLLYCGCWINTQTEKKRTDVQTSLRPRISKMSTATVTKMTRFCVLRDLFVPRQTFVISKDQHWRKWSHWSFLRLIFQPWRGNLPRVPLTHRRRVELQSRYLDQPWKSPEVYLGLIGSRMWHHQNSPK